MTDVNINLPILQKTEYEMLPTMLKIGNMRYAVLITVTEGKLEKYLQKLLKKRE